MQFRRTLLLAGLLATLTTLSPAWSLAACDPITCRRIGDINGDGVINATDLTLLINHIFFGGAASRYLGAQDLNGDGISNATDLTTIINVIFFGGSTQFPHRVYTLTGRTRPGSTYLLGDDSIQYRIADIYSVGSDSTELGVPNSCAKTDTIWICPGTHVQGDDDAVTPSAFIVRRTGYIHAVGTSTAPVVLTSQNPPGSRERGDWGGFVINGCAPNNNSPSFLYESEGNGGLGGGNDIDDNSGCLVYFRVEFAGREFTLDNELNGITVTSVGRGTTMEYVQVNQNADDGIEWFGGRVNVRYAVLSGCDDDTFDSDIGAQWKGQFLIAIHDPTKSSSANHNGFEWDNHPTGNEFQPRMQPTVYNATIIGQAHNYTGTTLHAGAHIRRGAATHIRNTIFTRWRRGLDVDNNPPAQRLIDNDSIYIGNSIWYDIQTFNADADSLGNEFRDNTVKYANEIYENAGATPLAEILVDVVNWGLPGFPDFRPIVGANPIGLDTKVGATPPDDGFFDPTATFIGAIDPSDPSPWWEGWTDLSQY